MPYFETEFRQYDQVRFKEDDGLIYVIVDDPTDQSVATCAGDGLERCSIMELDTLLGNDDWKLKPHQTASLKDIESVCDCDVQKGTEFEGYHHPECDAFDGHN